MGIDENSQEGRLEIIRQETVAAIDMERAMVEFGAYCSTLPSSEFNETPDMVGEICPDDYEFTMREFFELTFA